MAWVGVLNTIQLQLVGRRLRGVIVVRSASRPFVINMLSNEVTFSMMVGSPVLLGVLLGVLMRSAVNVVVGVSESYRCCVVMAG